MTTSRYTYRPRHAAPRTRHLAIAGRGLVSFLFALMAVGLFGSSATAAQAPVESWATDTCEAVDANALTEFEIVDLISYGYVGSPSDGAELLYPPHCLPADAQLTDQDDATGCTYLSVPSITMDEQLDLIAAGWDVDVYEDGSAHAFDPNCYPSFV